MPKLDSDLHREVQEYLMEMNITKAERIDVWYWLHHGVDIYDNPWSYYNDAGRPGRSRYRLLRPADMVLDGHLT